jgi:hypothetical protein
MNDSAEHRFSGPVTVIHERRLPETATPAGYAALIDAYALQAPVPITLCAIGARHKSFEQDGWRLFTPRHAPAATLEGHLRFALKYEGLDLCILRRLFLATGPGPIEAMVRATPTGRYARRIWFLYEWLLQRLLALPDQGRGGYVEALDTKLQFGDPLQTLSSRHCVYNNLPGTPLFCPLVRRTETLDRFIGLGLAARARAIAAAVPADLLARTAAFLLLKDSRASYVIEGENPPQDRVQRWGQVIGQAGLKPVDLDELLRLQKIVIGKARFVHLGLRREGGFIGAHERNTGAPIPDHVSARHQDLRVLVQGLAEWGSGHEPRLDPVIAAAILAFGFVFIHPFEDGNGRIHRFLIHHVLAARGFNPPGVVFPVSAAILDRIVDYRATLESYSKRVLPLIDWRATEKGNVDVLNYTADYYQYFDATPQAEFLYACVQKTVDEDLPREADFLRRYDTFRADIEAMEDMPDRISDLLFRMLHQNGGKLSKRARDKEFATLTEAEAGQVEAAYVAAFNPDA